MRYYKILFFTTAMLIFASCDWGGGDTVITYGNGTSNGTEVFTAPEPVIRAENETSLSVTWEAVWSAASYNLWYSEGSNIQSATLVSGVTSPYVISGITSGKMYYVWLKAYNGKGQETEYSTCISGTILNNMSLTGALEWISTNAQSNAFYTVLLKENASLTPTNLYYTGKSVTLALRGIGGERTVSFSSESPSYSLFNVRSGVTFMLEDDVKLLGNQYGAAKSLVEVDGGRFIMNGGTITGNKSYGNGGGVCVTSGSFTMNGGTISENITTTSWWSYGGGVYVIGSFTMNNGNINGNTGRHGGVYVNGTFTMNAGTISGNTAASDEGGGVYAEIVIMNGGTISGNITNYSGGGVYVYNKFTMNAGTISSNTAVKGGGVCASNTFIKTGGTIYGSNASASNMASSDEYGHAIAIGSWYSINKKRNTTAGPGVTMDSSISGPSGGWE